MDLMSKEVLARIYRERDWSDEGGTLFLQERSISKNWGWIDNRWIIIQGNQRRDLHVSHRLYSAAELSTLLMSCGFERPTVFGNFYGIPYDHKADRMVLVARKE